MFSPKKKISKADLKKSIVSANEKLKSANSFLEKSIKENEVKLQDIKKELTSAKEALKDTTDISALANNELEAVQSNIFTSQKNLRDSISKIASLNEESEALTKYNKQLENERVGLTGSIKELAIEEEALSDLTANLDDLLDSDEAN